MGPGLSCREVIGTTPERLTNPREGLMPTVEVTLAGHAIEPSVSVPIVTAAKLAAAATADPLEDRVVDRGAAGGLVVLLPSAMATSSTGPAFSIGHASSAAMDCCWASLPCGTAGAVEALAWR